MPRYLIKRAIPGAGSMSIEDLRDASRKSCQVLGDLGPHIQWVQSYVTDDAIHCIYIAPSEDDIRTHAQQAGFPANEIMEVRAIIDPVTAEA